MPPYVLQSGGSLIVLIRLRRFTVLYMANISEHIIM